jgi:hypothetical protein
MGVVNMHELRTEDVVAIEQLEALFGHVIDDAHDSGQFDRLEEVFTPDATYDYTFVGGEPLNGVPTMIRHWLAHPEQFPLSHHITNVVVTQDEDGTVRVRSKVLAPLGAALPRTSVYDDVVVPTAEGWRIQYRSARQRTGDSRSG